MIPLQVFFVAMFSFEHSIQKSIKKRIFDSFWQDLGFRASFWRDPGENSSNMEKNDIEIRKLTFGNCNILLLRSRNGRRS